MSDLFIFDRFDNLLTILSNEGEGSCTFWDAPYKETINQGSEFQFSAAGDHEDSQYIMHENQVAFLDKDGIFKLFTIKELEKSNDGTRPTITAYCEAAMLELNESIIEDVRPYNTTLQDALRRALVNSRWVVGQTADLGLGSTNFYYINVTSAINEIINTWGGELRDRVEIEGNKIVGRYIDILVRRGEDTGKRWEIDKDLLSISEKTISYPKTALYGRGSSSALVDEEGEETGGFSRKLTFADVEWKVSNGDPVDKPLGQEWVGDLDALSIYGIVHPDGTYQHREGIYESEQEDPALLLAETWEALQQQKHPIRNFEMDVFLLEQITGYDHEKVRLGDTTYAIDRSFAKPIEVEERIIVFEYDISDPENTGTVEMGNYIDLYENERRLDAIEAKLKDKGGFWDNGGHGGGGGLTGPITDDNFLDIIPPQIIYLEIDARFQTIEVKWEYTYSIWLSNYEVYASQVKGFTPDASNLVFRGKTNAYIHTAKPNELWYFRVRGINSHGKPGPFSDEKSGETIRLISDDILFGPDIAAELRELSKTADLLADNTLSFNKLAADVKTPINEALTNAENATGTADSALIQAQNAFNNATDAITKADLLTGQFSTISQTVSGIQTTVASKAEQSQVTQLAGLLDSKISTTDADLRYATSSQITQLSNNINLRVEKDKVINQINLSTEGILIAGNKIRITGQTTIDNGIIKTAHIGDAQITSAKIQELAVGNAAIANLAVSRAKLQDAIIGTAQIDSLAVTNAKIGALAVDNAKISSLDATKINATKLSAIAADLGTVTAGTLRGAYIYGSTVEGGDVKSSSTADYLDPNYTNRAQLYYGRLTVQSRSALNQSGLVEIGDGALKAEGKAAQLYMPSAFYPKSGTLTNYFNGGLYSSSDFYLSVANRFYIGSSLSDNLILETSLMAPKFWLYGSVGLRFSNDESGQFLGSSAVYSRTYSGAANVYVSSSGVFGRSTSATKYKTNISEIKTDGYAERILELVPKKWYSKSGVEVAALQMKYPDLIEEQSELPYIGAHYGLIAEDVEAAGLEKYVQYEIKEDGTKEIEGIMYDRLWTLLIPIIKEQREEINTLKDEMKIMKEGMNN